MLVYSTNAGLQYKARINITYLKMSFKYFRFISNVNFDLYIRTKDYLYSQNNAMKMAGNLRKIRAFWSWM